MENSSIKLRKIAEIAERLAVAANSLAESIKEIKEVAAESGAADHPIQAKLIVGYLLASEVEKLLAEVSELIHKEPYDS